MFAGLIDLNTSVPKKPKKIRMKRGMSFKACKAANEQFRIINKITNSIAKTSNMTNDFADLRRLRTVALNQGINKALMFFANPNNAVISRIAKNIPSNESLDAVSIGKSDRRTKAAIEGMSETLESEPKLISDWTHSSADDVDQLLMSITDQVKDLGEAVSQFLQNIEMTDVNDEDMSVTTSAVPFDVAMSRIESLLEVLPDMDSMVSDPCDRDAMDIYKEKVSNLVSKMGPMTGMAVDSENPHHIVSGSMSEDYTPNESTLIELGYTKENMIMLLKKSDMLLDEINGLIERKEKMVSHLHETADRIAEVDNTVPPAVDGAIDEDPDSDDSSGFTQCDMYHCQVSTHLHCLMAVVCTSIAAVHEVLMVADQLSDDQDGDDDEIVIVGEVSE